MQRWQRINLAGVSLLKQAESEIQKVLVAAREDVLPWEDWPSIL